MPIQPRCPSPRALPNLFARLNLTQFLGALNDNLFKLLLVLCALHTQGGSRAAEVTAVGSAVFVAPFLLATPLGGRLADRRPKGTLIRAMKTLEVAVMGCGAWALASGNLGALYAALAAMATQSALFGPAKYGAVPELVPAEELSRANSQMEAATYLAIVAGTALAPLWFSATRQHPAWTGSLCLVLAASGWWAARGVDTAAAQPSTPVQREPGQPRSGRRSNRKTLGRVCRDRNLLLPVLGGAAFTALGAFAQLALVPYGIHTLGFSETQAASLFVTAALGIGSGALLAGRLSRRNVELGILPLGAGLMSLGCCGLGLLPPHPAAAYSATALFGLGGGLFVVPTHAAVQFAAPPAHRGGVIAASSWLGWVGVLAASLTLYLLDPVLGWNPRHQFTALALATATLGALTLRLVPDFTLRFIARVLVRTFYRLQITGREQIPVRGGALIVPNHVSLVDALLLLATTQRRIRFVMLRSIYQRRGLRWLFRLMGAIPISSKDHPRQIAAALREARAALGQGFLVCIFAEGRISRDGQLQSFRPGLERIVRGTQFPIIPAHLGGVWGSIFSYADGEGIFKRPRRIPYPASVSFGDPLPSSTGADEVRAAVAQLAADHYRGDNADGDTLAKRLVHSCRKHWSRRAVADTSGKQLRYGELLAGAVTLATPLTRGTAPATNVGVLVPPSVGGALVNLSLTLAGRVPVNLNFTASERALQHALESAGIERVIASRALVERLCPHLQLPGVVWLEDLVMGLGRWQKLGGLLKARCWPRRLLLADTGAPATEDTATILFSSGSTGLPKGVVLSHRNLLANVDAVAQSLAVDAADNLCAALPLFHSFGLTATLWLPLLKGFSATYHSNPLEGAKVAAAVREQRSTILLATPTFLLAYLRRAQPRDLRSLRLVMTGAEPLKPKLAERFERKFGVRPLEGYGATELSPVATFNLPPQTTTQGTQVRAREGSVGRPLPGVQARVVDPDSGTPLAAGEVGLLQFAGPNVFRRYLGQGDSPLMDGRWYDSGDLGRIDSDGFVWITGRLARFSKIGGEMVPHGAIEDALQPALDAPEALGLAVTAVPDAKRGERLVVLYVAGATTAERLATALRHCSLPNLWKPAPGSLHAVAELPLLGSGKLDLRALRELAQTAQAA